MKKEKKPTGKVAIKTDTIVAAYDILNTRKREQDGQFIQGFRLSGLETTDMFRVLYAIKAMKPVATAFDDFRKDAYERLKPEDWDEIQEKRKRMDGLPAEERIAVRDAIAGYNKNVVDCLQAELDKEAELEAFEHLDDEAFGLLVKDNGHILDACEIAILKETIA